MGNGNMGCHALSTPSLINLESQMDHFLLIGILIICWSVLGPCYNLMWFDIFHSQNLQLDAYAHSHSFSYWRSNLCSLFMYLFFKFTYVLLDDWQQLWSCWMSLCEFQHCNLPEKCLLWVTNLKICYIAWYSHRHRLILNWKIWNIRDRGMAEYLIMWDYHKDHKTI